MKYISLLIVGSLILTLTACSSHQEVTEIPKDVSNRFNGINADTIKIITDSKTNCKYIYVEDGQGNYKTTAMSPLYIDSNTVDCSK